MEESICNLLLKPGFLFYHMILSLYHSSLAWLEGKYLTNTQNQQETIEVCYLELWNHTIYSTFGNIYTHTHTHTRKHMYAVEDICAVFHSGVLSLCWAISQNDS